jgi:hypothetical protein
MRRLIAAFALSVLAPSAVAAQSPDLDQAVAGITEEDFYWRVSVIAADSMLGRDTPSPGLDMTAAWIASEFERFGLKGGMPDGSYIQHYPLRSMALNVDESAFTTPDGHRLAFGDDVLPLFGGVGDQVTSGGLVLVSGSAGTLPDGSVEGHHAVIVVGDMTEPDRQLFGMLRAVRSGGAASILVMSTADDAAWAAQAARALQGNVRKGWGESANDGGQPAFPPMLQIRGSALRHLLAHTDVDLGALRARSDGPMQAEALSGMDLTLSVVNSETETSAPNVVAILEGSDPELKDEYVVFSGHMDHVGVGTPDENGDSIFNGADDDASGTIAVVEVAEALAALEVAPRRSMMFVIVSGEEKGLWGSEYFAENPTVPVEQMVANLNADMVGRNWPDTIVAIGKEHSDLGETMNRVNDMHPDLGMTAIDDIWPDERFYFRSDHFNFARKGVPILFFFNGTHDDYHGRDDEVENMDAEKAARIARLIFYLGVEVGNADERPQWNPESYERIVSDDG